MRTVLAITTLMLLTTFSALAQKDRKATTMAANQTFMDVFAKGATNMGALYTTNGQLLFANSDIIQGTSAISAFWKGAYQAGMRRMKLETVEATQEGNIIVEQGRYVSYGAKEEQLDKGKYIIFWKQENGVWKLHRDIGTTSLPAPKTSN